MSRLLPRWESLFFFFFFAIITLFQFALIVGANTSQIEPSGERHHVIQFINDNVYFQASSVKAIFRDGTRVDYDKEESVLFNSTIIGDSLSFREEKTDSFQVRLYFIPPTLDWRKNETYCWKLNQAWMSDATYGWVFWNVNGYINSELQVLQSGEVFQCEHVEFTFWHNAPHHRFFSGSDGKLVMENVEMAAFLSTGTDNFTSLTVVNPCSGKGSCHALNGNITCTEGSRFWKYEAATLSIIVAVSVIAIANRTSNHGNYSRIGHEEEKEENDCHPG